MVVNPVTLTPKIAEVNGVTQKEMNNESALADKVSISSKAREIQQERVESKQLAKKVIALIPDIREEKISQTIARLNTHSGQEEKVISTVAERMAKIIGIS